MDSESDSSSSFSLFNISSSASTSPIPSEQSSQASVTGTGIRHSVGARILAITLLDRNISHHEITAQTNISKAQIYNLRQKAIFRG